MDDANIQLLCATDIVIPGDVAAAVLASCEPSVLAARSSKIASSIRFAGANAIACARSHPIRASIIATRTADIEVQRALLELSAEEEFESVADQLAHAELVSEQALLRDIHDRVYRADRHHAPKAILDRVEASHMLDWFHLHHTAYGGNLPYLALRIALWSASTGSATPARRFVGICDRILESAPLGCPSSRYVPTAISRLTTTLVDRGASAMLDEIVSDLSVRTSNIVARAAWDSAEVIDVNIAMLAFRHVDAADFYEQQRLEMERYSREVMQYPPVLRRQNLQCTDDAWRIVAATWPGLLLEPLQDLVNSDPQRELLVELALASGRSDLAHTLVDRKYHPDGERSGPLLDAAQYAIAASNIRNVERSDRQNPQSTYIGGEVTVSHIPSGAAMVDVLRIWSEHALSDIVSTLCDAKHAMWHEWRPTREEFDELLARIERRSLHQALRDGLHGYALDEHRPSTEQFARARPYLDAVAARVASTALLEEHGGPVYVSTRLNEAFEADVDGWLCAWHLASRSTRPLDAVIAAARKLT